MVGHDAPNALTAAHRGLLNAIAPQRDALADIRRELESIHAQLTAILENLRESREG